MKWLLRAIWAVGPNRWSDRANLAEGVERRKGGGCWVAGGASVRYHGRRFTGYRPPESIH